MKFTPVKSAQKRSSMARVLAGTAASMIPMATESASQLDHVWNLFNMLPEYLTRKALKSGLEVKSMLDFQLITQAELDDLPKGNPQKGEKKGVAPSIVQGIIWPKQGQMAILTGKT